jgi:hypothetical protein
MTRPLPAIRHDLVEALARITAIQTSLEAAYAELRFQQPGFPTSTGGGGSAPQLQDDGHPGGLDRIVLSEDPAAHDLSTLSRAAGQINDRAAELHRVVSVWASGAANPKAKHSLSGGDCHACGRYCSGSATDRLRAGLCNACRMAWQRAHAVDSRLERGDWLLARRRALMELEPRVS